MQMDKENRGWSLLRYKAVCCSIDMQDMFENEELKKEIREAITHFFDSPSMKNVKLLSTFFHSYYVEIDFQGLPTSNPSDVISSLKSSTSKKILKSNPKIKTKWGGLWNKSYFLVTTEQAALVHKDEYLRRQSELNSMKKMVGKKQ